MAINWQNVNVSESKNASILGLLGQQGITNAFTGAAALGADQSRRVKTKATNELTSDIYDRMAAGEDSLQIRSQLLKDEAKGGEADFSQVMDYHLELDKLVNTPTPKQQRARDVQDANAAANLSAVTEERAIANQLWKDTHPTVNQFGPIDDRGSVTELFNHEGIKGLIAQTVDGIGRDTATHAGGNELLKHIEEAFEGTDINAALLDIAIGRLPLQTNSFGDGFSVSSEALFDDYLGLAAEYKITEANRQEEAVRDSREVDALKALHSQTAADSTALTEGQKLENFNRVFGKGN